MSNELLPCPFCGCAMRVEYSDAWHSLKGQHAQLCVFDPYEAFLMEPATPEGLLSLVTAWNRRSIPDEPGARCSLVGWLDTAGSLRWLRADPKEARQLGWQPVYTHHLRPPAGEEAEVRWVIGERICGRPTASDLLVEAEKKLQDLEEMSCVRGDERIKHLPNIDFIRAVLSGSQDARDAKRVDRGEAVNLAHAIVSGDDKPTERGVQMLAEAVLRMDAALSGDKHE